MLARRSSGRGVAWIPAVLHGLSTAGTGAVVAKAMTRVCRESLSLQGVFKYRDREIEKKTFCAGLLHWSRGSLSIGLFSSWL